MVKFIIIKNYKKYRNFTIEDVVKVLLMKTISIECVKAVITTTAFTLNPTEL